MYVRAVRNYQQNFPADDPNREMAERELQDLRAGRFRKETDTFFYAGSARTWVLTLETDSDDEDDDEI